MTAMPGDGGGVPGDAQGEPDGKGSGVPRMTPHEALEIALELLQDQAAWEEKHPTMAAVPNYAEAAAVLEAWEKQAEMELREDMAEVDALIAERDALQKRIEELER